MPLCCCECAETFHICVCWGHIQIFHGSEHFLKQKELKWKENFAAEYNPKEVVSIVDLIF